MLNSIEIFFKCYFYVVLISRYNEHTIERLREDKKILDKDSKIDHLTGLYNRRSMEKFLNILEEQYKITNKPFGLILMDIDFFKKVNDTYGHQAGDKVLVEISRLIVYTLRKSDEVFRYGGEEILAVVPGVQTKEDVIKVANSIRSDIESLKIPTGENDVSVTISCGCTVFDGQEMESTIKRVDEALYMAKNNGRNRVEYL
ncbi:MAG: GGDEF domain-containing protein [Clostridia bacterium]|nr:GGDEF domain-containing protein [Clostridia bacterium]